MGGKAKLLVVEDNADLLNALTRTLQSSGYEVCPAGDAVDAVRSAVDEHPDLVLLDLGLPGGGGVGVLQHIENLPALCAIPVIVLSGRDPDFVRATVQHHHVAGFLRKPATKAELVEMVERALDGAPAARSTEPADPVHHPRHQS